MKTLPVLLLSLFSLAAYAADPAPTSSPEAKPADKPLAVVNGQTVPPVFGAYIRQNRVKRNMPADALGDDSVRDGAITAVLLAQEAVRKGLDKEPRIVTALEFQRIEMLGSALVTDHLRAHPVKEETVKAEYEKARAQAGETEYQVRHILVSSENEAKDLIAKLTTGKKARFEDLAKKHSKDPGAGNGGDLGWVLPANLVPEFSQAMVAMKKGEISKKPVQTKFGWHIIRMDDVRKLDFPPYDEVKNRIVAQLQQQQISSFVKQLMTTAKVE